MMRVGMVINELELGGAETMAVSLAGRLQAHGCATVIFSLASGGALEETARRAGTEVVALGFSRADPRAVKGLARALRAHPVDVLHLHLPRAGVLGRLAARRLGLHPVIYTEHNVWGGGAVIRHLNRWTMAWTDHVIAVSDEVRRCLLVQGVPPHRVTTIPNGIDVQSLQTMAARGPSLRALLRIPDGAPVVGTIANLHPRKGLETLVAALPGLCRRWPDLQAVVIGRDDGMGASLRRLAAQTGVEPALHLLGPRRDALALLRAFDVFVLPSRVEGMPIALLEAMALERPVVVTPVGGVPEVVRHKLEGLHVPVGDSEALARALDYLLEDPKEASAFGRRAAARVQQEFSLQRTAEEHARLYKVLASHSPDTRRLGVPRAATS
jgi:glycosyltransferase involved in cell wall biosynthesis